MEASNKVLQVFFRFFSWERNCKVAEVLFLLFWFFAGNWIAFYESIAKKKVDGSPIAFKKKKNAAQPFVVCEVPAKCTPQMVS